MNESLVTVIIPLFNKRGVIARAVESVVNQTVESWRLVVIDDGSTDGSIDAIAHYRNDCRITFTRIDNGGPGVARNVGLYLARSPYVAFLDADDEWMPNFLEVQTSLLESNPQAELVASAWMDGPGPSAIEALESAQVLDSTIAANSNFRDTKRIIDALHSSAVVARSKSVLRREGYYDAERVTYGEDAFLWAKYVFDGTYVCNPERLIIFHTDAGTLGHNRVSPYPCPPLIASHRMFLEGLSRSSRTVAGQYLQTYALFVTKRAIRQHSLGIALQTLSESIQLVLWRLTRGH